MSLNNNNVLIQFKRGSQSGWMDADKGNDPVLAQGEPGYHKETKGLKIGDGKTKWSELPYISSPSNIQDSDGKSSLMQKKDTESFTTGNENIIENSSININEDGTVQVGAFGEFSSSFGGKSQAFGKRSHTEGTGTIAEGRYSHAEGNDTFSKGINSHAEGLLTSSLGLNSHAEGNDTIAKGDTSHAEGIFTTAEGNYSHAEGNNSYTLGNNSHAEGCESKTEGDNSHAEGLHTSAIGHNSHAEGNNTISEGDSSHAEGIFTTTEGLYSHTEGNNTMTKGNNSHAEGCESKTEGDNSHAEGLFSIAISECQHVQGQYNMLVSSSAFIIGNGTGDDDHRSNAMTVDWEGNANIIGEYTSATGADYAEYFEWLDGNPEDEDRIGYLVTLNEDKIEYANSGDDVLGIVSGTAAVVGDTAVWDWQDKYLTDDFGRTIWDMVEEFSEVPEIEEVEVIDEEGNTTIEYKTTMVTKSMGFFPHRRLNPNYDESQTYIPRSKRPEWDCVGLMGKLHVRDDGTCVPGGYATAGVNGIATYSSEKTNMKVMKRLSDNIILVFMK